MMYFLRSLWRTWNGCNVWGRIAIVVVSGLIVAFYVTYVYGQTTPSK